MRSWGSRAHFIFPCSRATAFESDNGRSALVTGTALPAPFRTFRQPDVEAQLGRKLALGVQKSAGFAVRKNVEIKSVQVFDLDV